MADDVCFEFALTTSAGDNWSVIRTKIVDPVPSSVIKEDGQGFSGTTYLDFADAQHGWAVLKRSLPVGRSAGVMLRKWQGGRARRRGEHSSEGAEDGDGRCGECGELASELHTSPLLGLRRGWWYQRLDPRS